MKKTIQIITCILMLFASNLLSAQDKGDVVKTLVQSLRSHKNMEVTFTYQTIGDPTTTEDVKQGKAFFQDKAYKLIMEDQHVISDGTTTWHYIVEDEEMMVGKANDDDNPYIILDELERDDSGVIPVVDSKGNLKSLTVEIDEGVKLILKIIEMKFDQDFKEGFFSFNTSDYPNADIIDMR